MYSPKSTYREQGRVSQRTVLAKGTMMGLWGLMNGRDIEFSSIKLYEDFWYPIMAVYLLTNIQAN
jgi:hypothetical protein